MIINYENAERRLRGFERDYGSALAGLARHAALPVVLNPDFVQLLRVNYFLDPPVMLPFTAESELLLSRLCTEVDQGLYVIEPDMRDVLLSYLVQEYGNSRLHDVARLLWEYGQRGTPWIGRPGLPEAQQLTALNFIDPERAQEWLARAEQGAGAGTTVDKRWFVAMHKDLEGRAAAVERAEEQSTSEIPVRRFYSLTLVGSERHEEFLRLVRRLVDADAELCYATTAQSGQLPQSAVLIGDPGPRAAQIEEQLLAEVRDWGEGVTVEYQTSETRPYLMGRIVVSGPDNRRFELRNVPSTTPLSEIAGAVLEHTDTDLASAQRGQIQVMIHRFRGDGRLERLDPEHTLSDAGIHDGDELRVAAVARSLTEDEARRLVAELRQLLPELFYQEVDARAVLEEAGRGRGRQAVWRDAASFWSAELGALQQGAVRDGIQALILGAAAEYPGNDQLSAMAADVGAAPAVELRPAAVARSLTEDETRRLVAELRQLLPELFYQEVDARAVLEEAGRGRGRQAEWRNPDAFWAAELRALQQGAVRDGISALITAAAAEYPGNDQLAAMRAEMRAAPAVELRPATVTTSLTGDETRRLVAELRQLLPELFYEEVDARAVLEEAGRGRGRQAEWREPGCLLGSRAACVAARGRPRRNLGPDHGRGGRIPWKRPAGGNASRDARSPRSRAAAGRGD